MGTVFACCHYTKINAFESPLPVLEAAEREEPDDVPPGEMPRMLPEVRQMMMRRVHHNLGHPSTTLKTQLIRDAGATHDVLEHVKALECETCERENTST